MPLKLKKTIVGETRIRIRGSFFFAHKELDQLFFQEESMQLVPRDLIARISEETSKSCYSSFKNAEGR